MAGRAAASVLAVSALARRRPVPGTFGRSDPHPCFTQADLQTLGSEMSTKLAARCFVNSCFVNPCDFAE